MKTMKKTVSVFLALAFALVSLAVAPAAVSATEATPSEGESYNAYLGLQTPNWTYRNSYTDTSVFGTEFWDGLVINGSTDNGTVGTVTDAVIAGNGVYTVSVTDFGSQISDDFDAAGQAYFNLIFVSTDIPLDAGVSITDVTLTIDGSTIYTYEEYIQNPDIVDYVEISLYNMWNTDTEWPDEVYSYNAPKESVAITFTVSGMSYDNPDAVAEAEPEEESEASEEAGTTVESADSDDSNSDAATSDSASSSTSDSSSDSDAGFPIVPVVVVIVVIVIVVVVVVFARKKK